jgi:hypothetical protein
MGRTGLDATESDALYDGVGHHRFGHHGRGFFHLSGEERIEHLEELQRDLEEMTADVASRLEHLRRRESE